MIRPISIFLLIISLQLSAQNDSLPIKNGIDKISLLTTHHFGMFSSRINQNFREVPIHKNQFEVSIHSGNTFHPFVEAYLPEDPSTREQFSQTIWYNRQFNFIDQNTTPADYMKIVVDAVFKEFRLNYTFKTSAKSDATVTLRSFIPTEGHYPLSVFTNDEFIEWFHDNVAGGKDPFGRRFYGLNKVNIQYTDRNGKSMTLNKNQFIFSGIEFNHFYYPTIHFLSKNNMFLNIGSHLGVNTAKYNQSLDVGLSLNLQKKWKLQSNNEIRLGYGLSVLRKNLVDFSDNIDFGNNKFLGSFEAALEFTKYTVKNNYHSFTLNYQYQTRYNKQTEFGYYYLEGNREDIHSGWQNGIEKLYNNLSAWNFLYTYAKKYFSITLYFKEDLNVNNAPDVQTGIGVKFPLQF